MLAVVKTPLTKIRIQGRIPNRLLDVLVQEYGEDVRITHDTDDEKMDVFQTEWYKRIKKKLKIAFRE